MSADALYADPRLASLYDAFEADRGDLDAYLSVARELGAETVGDLGCGTGSLALRFAAAGLSVIGVDPAAASVDVARAKPGAEAVQWIVGDASSLPALGVDLVTMTGNAAQAVVAPDAWTSLLAGVRRALRPGGWFVVETRDPAFRGWSEWTRERSLTSADVARVGVVTAWVELTAVRLPLVSFRWTYVFPDGSELRSDSTLRFREQAEVAADLAAHGFVLEEVRGAPDRPGRELVFFARRAVDRERGDVGGRS